MKVSKNFYLAEFVPIQYYNDYVDSTIGDIDYRVILTAQALRDNLGVPLTINNWHAEGPRNESGLRIAGMKNYRPRSQHSYGRAADIVSDKITAQEMRDHILKNRDLYPHIRRLEDKVSWLHFDLRETLTDDIVLFNP